MIRLPDYHAGEAFALHAEADPYLRPAFSVRSRLCRLTWGITWALFYRCSPRPLHAWRTALLRLFGATLGEHCHFYPRSKVWAPWNLSCADHVSAADDVEIYNPAPIRLDSHVILSQGAYVCGASHDIDDPGFPLIAFATSIGAYAWICARASVGPGVAVGEGAVLGLGSVASHNLAPWTVYGGVPAVKLRMRQSKG